MRKLQPSEPDTSLYAHPQITQDFAPFLEAVILGPAHPAPSANPAQTSHGRGATSGPSDLGLALDARRRMKPMLDYIGETFQDAWHYLDR